MSYPHVYFLYAEMEQSTIQTFTNGDESNFTAPSPVHGSTNDTLLDDFGNATTIPSGASEKHFLEYGIAKQAMWLFFNSWKIISPPGILGNLIVLIVTIRMKPFNSSSLFMISLAAVDMTLVCGRIPFKELELETVAACKSLWYIFNVLPVYSNYILLFWTVERVIAVSFPLRVNEWCNLTNTTISIIGGGIFSALFCLPWALSHTKDTRSPYCSLEADWIDFLYNVWFIVDTTIFAFTPMGVIFFCNIVIIYKLNQSTKRHKKMTSSEEARKHREKEQRNTTITLLTVSFTFLILHTPIAVYQIFSFMRQESSQKERADWLFVNVIASSLMELQNSVNFYLYFLSGRKYREHTLSMILFWRKRKIAKGRQPVKSTGITNISESVSASNNSVIPPSSSSVITTSDEVASVSKSTNIAWEEGK